MTAKYPYQYMVVKYVPDPLKNEPRNIGVILSSRDLGYINCKFTKTLQIRLGSTASGADIRILKAYIEDFAASFRPFSADTSTGNLLKNQVECFSENYLSNLSSKGLGKIQFGMPSGGLTEYPEKELEYLFSTFVGEVPVRTSLKHSYLKTEIKKEFTRRRWIAEGQKRGEGFVLDYTMSGARSHVKYLFDFALKNGILHLVETVDLRKKNRKLWDIETFQAALKFDDLKHGLEAQGRKDAVVPYSIVALPEDEDATFHLKILKAYSHTFKYTDEKDREVFFKKMGGLVSHPGMP